MGLVWVMVMATESSWRNKGFLGRPFGGWENEIPRDKNLPLYFVCSEKKTAVWVIYRKASYWAGTGYKLSPVLTPRVLSKSGRCVRMGSGGILCDFRVHAPSPRSKHWGIITKVPQCWTICCGKCSLSRFMDEKIGYCSWGNGGWFWMVS